MYDFEIVFTTQSALSRTFRMPLSVDPVPDEVDESATIEAGLSQAIMKTLLADRHSVDTQFIFTADNIYANIRFLAHRPTLSRYKTLDDLVKEEAVLGYLADCMRWMCDDSKDPFETFRDYKDCHSKMPDAMQYKSVPVDRRHLALTSAVRSLAIVNY
ncbi:hypothetical protein EC957_011997 [Mortierella hygrophila]|uniref:Uncharacterized protein n=1 Tax=Mortierella hygrophila TaxID=979708 RepID=A0A9P6FH62_9FUNG|nr:hypothetical protein EC957_011997 [Mortierella hygrophila]